MRLILLLASVLLASFAQADNTSSEDGRLIMTFESTATAFKVNQPEFLPFQLINQNKDTQCCTRVEVHAGMPGHGHGMPSIPVVEQVSEHSYIIQRLFFTMPGEWVITLIVYNDDGELDRFILPFNL